MAKNQNTFEKRRRETEKKFRADEKRKRRQAKKEDDARPAPRVNEGNDADENQRDE